MVCHTSPVFTPTSPAICVAAAAILLNCYGCVDICEAAVAAFLKSC
jgi:hypothetical protein